MTRQAYSEGYLSYETTMHRQLLIVKRLNHRIWANALKNNSICQRILKIAAMREAASPKWLVSRHQLVLFALCP